MKLRRSSYYDARQGHTRGHWLLVGHPLSLGRTAAGLWRIGLCGSAGCSDAEQERYNSWWVRLARAQRFERRADALAWLETALSADPPEAA